MKPFGLTSMQRQVLDFIRSYIAQERRSPSYRDITDGMGFKSLSQAHRLVTCLIDRGCVRRLDNQARSIIPVEGVLGSALPLSLLLNADVSAAAAGRGISTEAFIEEAVRAHLSIHWKQTSTHLRIAS